MKNFIIILLILLSYEAYSQLIKGTILDKDTKKPIDFAVAYFAGTFSGVNTDKNGYFELDISKNRSMSLTISALGYYSKSITDFSPEKQLVVWLTPKVFELNEVVIAGNLKNREKNLRLFRKQFLGETPNGRLCKITNENDISLVMKNDTLEAFASKPILIENNALGYRITFFLDRFEYDENNLMVFISGNILFNQDLATKDSETEKLERERRSAYYGSKMQFFRALWDNKLDSEGFAVRDSMNKAVLSDKLNGRGENNTKFLKHHAAVWIKYRSEAVESCLEIFGDSLYFDKNGASVEGIRWHGKMGNQRIGDTLPFEYFTKGALTKESDQ